MAVKLTLMRLTLMRLRLLQAWKKKGDFQPGGFFENSYDCQIKEAQEDLERLIAEERFWIEHGQRYER